MGYPFFALSPHYERFQQLTKERDALDAQIELAVDCLAREARDAQDALAYARMAIKYHAALQREFPAWQPLTEEQYKAALEYWEKAGP